jgi:hypothetical protein
MTKAKNTVSDKSSAELLAEIHKSYKPEDRAKQIDALKKTIIGAKVKAIRFMTDEEGETIYGDAPEYSKPIIIELDTGVEINALCDEEGNGPGVMAFFNKYTGTEAYDWDLAK